MSRVAIDLTGPRTLVQDMPFIAASSLSPLLSPPVLLQRLVQQVHAVVAPTEWKFGRMPLFALPKAAT
jgi:hypothetical protein